MLHVGVRRVKGDGGLTRDVDVRTAEIHFSAADGRTTSLMVQSGAVLIFAVVFVYGVLLVLGIASDAVNSGWGNGG